MMSRLNRARIPSGRWGHKMYTWYQVYVQFGIHIAKIAFMKAAE